jgi:hypothetical protein
MDLTPSDVVDAPESDQDDPGDEQADAPVGSSDDPTPETSSTSSLKDALFSTSPEQNLEDVEAPYDPERGGVTRIYRGIRKMLDIDGLPAIADIGIGAIEWFEHGGPDVDLGSDEDDDQEESSDAPVPGGESERV